MSNSILPEELLTMVAQIASNTAIEYYKGEIAKADKDKKKRRINDTKRQLAAYRRIKSQLEDEGVFTEEEKAEYRWEFVKDLMGNTKDYTSKSERIIKEEERIRQENMYALYRIENAMKLYKEECEKSPYEEDIRRYRIIEALHISDEPMTVQELAKQENVSEKTIYRDMGIAYKIIAIYLYGI